MNLYDIVNRILMIEYALMVILSLITNKPVAGIYWFGAVILQLGITLGLK